MERHIFTAEASPTSAETNSPCMPSRGSSAAKASPPGPPAPAADALAVFQSHYQTTGQLQCLLLREALAQQLRALEAITLEHLDGAGPEFALVLVRRDEIGCAEILAEIPEDIAQIERAARKLFG